MPTVAAGRQPAAGFGSPLGIKSSFCLHAASWLWTRRCLPNHALVSGEPSLLRPMLAAHPEYRGFWLCVCESTSPAGLEVLLLPPHLIQTLPHHEDERWPLSAPGSFL